MAIPYSKEQQLKSKRVKHTQRQMGDISSTVDRELKERSRGICERCGKSVATERAHLTGRKQLKKKTAVTDLMHLCTPCHDWMDETTEGIQTRKFIAYAINTALQNINEK
ncbi:hypothetical protein BK129_14645 [Paenibacillus amylolyticus]|uniref:hypothetical protein n=1 Tax=Paenibacillus TaxID=44249 RepID=UPI00096C0C71|nr:hypothetical protein [Paenibacillus amylolyticus]OMF05223.1 hypothetical protein BK129_14645 [Paenibacillus amylolyticus]